MLILNCPHCGPRDQDEFTYGRDATCGYPSADAPLSDWVNYVYWRPNPKGSHREYWHHSAGCRGWIEVVRDTVTHRILETRLPSRDAAQPAVDALASVQTEMKARL